MKFSANLGYLWSNLELLDAIRAAAEAGFEAVEFHWPYVTQPLDVALTTELSGLAIVSLNTVGGDLARREFGLAALPGRHRDAQAAVDKALAYAADVSALKVHVLAGKAEGDLAAKAFVETLTYAANRAAGFGIDILIEPINHHDVPGYFLSSPDLAADIIDRIDAPNLRLLFDCYHLGRMGLDVMAQMDRHREIIGHVQVASVPDRHEPDQGEVDYAAVFSGLKAIGYAGFIGAEYRPRTTTEAGLGWIETVISRMTP